MVDEPQSGDGEHERSLIRAARQGARSTPTEGGRGASDLGIAGYDIVRELHRGGQGVVYLAVQHGTNRRVAIKVLGAGRFAGERDRARFDREVQVLGQLNHPNIVAIHETGEVDGSFYFVMDYVAGSALEQFIYSASDRLPVRKVVALVIKVCHAISEAHVRGVIHRDIKPGNIRVNPEGEPRVLDFGLAKVLTTAGSDSFEADLMTHTGQFVGSLPWSSPEQAEGVIDEIDVRSDVYSLGVVFFQLLTGRFPYEVIGPMREVLARIAEEEPQKPSELNPEVDDEVETIVLKCLSKERDRRYQSAGELARDLERYLAGEPIEAKRDSTAYMLRKYLRKYRIAVIAACVFVVTLVGFSVGMGVLASAERTQRTRAEDVLGFLRDVLEEADPIRGQGLDTTIVQGMESVLATIVDSPRTSGNELDIAAVMHTAGTIFVQMGLFEKAEPLLSQAFEIRLRRLGRNANNTQATANSLAITRRNLGQFAAAEELYRVALAVVLRRSGREATETLATRSNLAQALWPQGKEEEAREQYELVMMIASGEEKGDQRARGVAQGNLGMMLLEFGEYDEARVQLAQSHALLSNAFSATHWFALRVEAALAIVDVHLAVEAGGDPVEAIERLRRVSDDVAESFGDRSPRTLELRERLAEALVAAGEFEQGVGVVNRVLAVAEAAHVPPWQRSRVELLQMRCRIARDAAADGRRELEALTTRFRGMEGVNGPHVRECERLLAQFSDR